MTAWKFFFGKQDRKLKSILKLLKSEQVSLASQLAKFNVQTLQSPDLTPSTLTDSTADIFGDIATNKALGETYL